MKTGDTVRHKSGEIWLVAYVRGDDLAWCGWPSGLARTYDCELVKECSEQERLDLLIELSSLADHRGAYARRELEKIEIH